MADTFSFTDSLLFAPTQAEPASPLEFGASEPFGLPDTAQISRENAQPAETGQSGETAVESGQSECFQASGVNADGKDVRLFDGSLLRLKRRVVRPPNLLPGETDSILDMDKLHERVRQRESLQASRREIRRRQNPSVPTQTPQIWADKYRPKQYLQLCSAGNERQYRAVMHWLRKWSSVVFGHAPATEDGVDLLGRPFRKLLLVHGPLGVGKTAAVHLIAQQMGYAVQELNAANSMDTMHGAEVTDAASRFANATAALRLKIKNALTSNSITSGGRPTCLVIDEIDSSINAGDIVRVLGDLVFQDLRSDTKTGRKPFVLNRPIICIANDIYSHTVRAGPNPMDKLRPLCELVPFRRPAVSGAVGTRINVAAQKSVKELLAAVSAKESLGLDSKEIAEIFEVCEGDIRACLNYMQFSSRRLDPDLHGPAQTRALSKDTEMSWFAMVDQLFRRDPGMSKDDNFAVMMELLLSHEGNAATSTALDKVMRGCFNRYLDVVHLQDDSNVRVAQISDWMYYYDMMTSAHTEMGQYPTVAALKFWSLFSEINAYKWKAENSLLPNARAAEFEAFETLKQNRAVVKHVSGLLPVEVRMALSGSSASPEAYACQFLPLLDRMLSPEVGSAKIKASLRPHERHMVESLATITKKWGLELETVRDLDTQQVSLAFAPNWDSLTVFDTEFAPVPAQAQMRSSAQKRQWLFPLLEAEFILGRTEIKRLREDSPVDDVAKSKRARMASSLDFFKNRYDNLNSQLDVASKPARHSVLRTWVKYHEGYSNAVRKNIGWQDLWQP